MTLPADPLGLQELSPNDVMARGAWASRRGHPYWLWPEVTPASWRAALAEIESVTRQVLGGEIARTPLDGDLRALGLAAYTSGMGPLLGCWIEEGRLVTSAPTAALMKFHLAHNRVRNQVLAERAINAAQVLAKAGVTATVLKGMHTAHVYFPEPGARPVSDIDLFIPRAQMAAAESALSAAGFTPGRLRKPQHQRDWTDPGARAAPRTLGYAHAEDPWALDVQATLNRYCSARSVVRLDDIHNAEADLPWPLSPLARTLGQPLLTLQLAAHASGGFRSLTMIRLVELISVIRRDTAEGSLSFAELLAQGQRMGGLRFVYPALNFCERLAPGLIDETVLKACEADATPALRRLVAAHSPSTAQPLDRLSMRERFMWARGPGEALQQAIRELWPPGFSAPMVLQSYRRRGWRLLRETSRMIDRH